VLLTEAGSRVSPDVAVLDAGPESLLLGQLGTPSVVLLDDLDRAAAARALRAGARAVLPRDAAPEEIRAAVRAAAAGLAALPTGVATMLVDGARAPLEPEDHVLTPRELQILTLLAEGLVNKQIAERLGISEHTVKTHLAAIYERLEVSNRAEAVATGLRRGLLLL
jgi:DNA-binding NarL/FixJ family response regulator